MHVGKARLKSCVYTAARTGYCCGIAAFLLLVGSRSLQDAIAEGDTRTITMHHIHTKENITITYKRNGRYDEAALKKINYFLRDWRRDEETKMEPLLIDLAWEVQREAGGGTIWVVCGYRAPQTNAMLRRRSGGVARFSQHMLGRALDFYIPGAPLENLRVAGLRQQRGGVGYYPSSGAPFVHLDVGSVRHWPRMTHEQLARVFPDGRTVHIPSDGHPLSGYALALADISKRGNRPSGTSLEAARGSGINVEPVVASNDWSKRNPLAKLFGLGANDDEDAEADSAAPSPAPAAPATSRRPARAAVIAAANQAAEQKAAEQKPLAPARIAASVQQPKPAQPVQVAAATFSPLEIASVPVLPAPRPAQFAARGVPAELAPARIAVTEAPPRPPLDVGVSATTANDVITARGYWQGLPDGVTAAQPATDSANPARAQGRRIEMASADPELTGTAGPWRIRPLDRVPPELALAYAAQPRPEPAPRAAPMGTGLASASGQNDVTVALKRAALRAKALISLPHHAPVAPAKTAHHPNDPWLRAIVLSPSVNRFLTITLLGARDYRRLEPLMRKPAHTVMMTFSDDPHLGLQHDRFSGSAVVFVSTVTFPGRTAALQ